ncbi:integrase [Xanthomonas fragariae]|uniref:Integrase n=1 Tax=Xanthomonas fragariae TaxID=48664 RepID=A0A1Y6HRI1_9XANT|nr:hypothetical protein BER92_19020 [Xanthomonas fragariae]ENZ96603.1 integrase [Xanthomonas fragariae LMG 25863]AOD19805.1 hypothetical protein BER93_19075 [Xanthomonas fragariae]SMQ93445.1 integrase [Xanthomonas fragariae]SMQ97359.1 hypothetical protein PD885_00087 [Xanthomonas fragariae]
MTLSAPPQHAYWTCSIERGVGTLQHFHYDDHAQLHQHLADFIDAYNSARRLNALKGQTP